MPPITTSLLRAETIEQVMRLTGDDTLLLPFLAVEPGSRPAHAALGRLLSETSATLEPGCPLMVFVAGVPLSPSWRSQYPPAPESLWTTYEFLSALYGPLEGTDHYASLEALRIRSEEDIAA